MKLLNWLITMDKTQSQLISTSELIGESFGQKVRVHLFAVAIFLSLHTVII